MPKPGRQKKQIAPYEFLLGSEKELSARAIAMAICYLSWGEEKFKSKFAKKTLLPTQFLHLNTRIDMLINNLRKNGIISHESNHNLQVEELTIIIKALKKNRFSKKFLERLYVEGYQIDLSAETFDRVLGILLEIEQ